MLLLSLKGVTQRGPNGYTEADTQLLLLVLKVVFKWQTVSQRPREGHFVCVLQLAAKGNTAGDRGYFYGKIF